MDLSRARYLVSPEGRIALEGLDPALGHLPVTALAGRLRRLFEPAAAAALGEQLVLRARARERWGKDLGFLLTASGLEMMTHPAVAERRAARLRRVAGAVVDLTCGLGGDLRAFESAGLATAGLERDRVTALLASANAPGAEVAGGSALALPLNLTGRAVFIDPSRRDSGRRRFDPAAFSPPWPAALELAAQGEAGVVKAPPGLAHAAAPPDAELEFVQLGRSMREATVWVGGDAIPGLRRAVLLPAAVELDSSEPEVAAEAGPIEGFVFDPESCVTRAGVVRHLAYRLGAHLLDPSVAYLSGSRPALDPLAATFEVLEVAAFSISGLKQLLRSRRWSPVEVRRRAFPVEPDELRRLLGRMEGDPVTLLCTTLAGRRTVVIARRVLELQIAREARQ